MKGHAGDSGMLGPGLARLREEVRKDKPKPRQQVTSDGSKEPGAEHMEGLWVTGFMNRVAMLPHEQGPEENQ